MAVNMTWMGWLGWALLTSLLLGVAVMVIAVRRGNTNCLNVAAIGWIGKRGRSWIALRRSLNVQGKVPHFAHMMEKGDRMVVVRLYTDEPEGSHSRAGEYLFCLQGHLPGAPFQAGEHRRGHHTQGGGALAAQICLCAGGGERGLMRH